MSSTPPTSEMEMPKSPGDLQPCLFTQELPAVETLLVREASHSDKDLEKNELKGSAVQVDEEWSFPGDEGDLKSWLVVFSCFIFTSTTMGWGQSWGIFQSWFSEHQFKDTPLSVLSLVGGLQYFLMALISFFAGKLGDRYGYKLILAISVGVCIVGFVLCAFASKLWELFMCQGFLLGVGMGLGMPIVMSIPAQFFLKKRGLATGVAVSGAGLGGAVSSLFVRLLLVRVGQRNTYLIFSAIHTVLWVVSWLVIEVRIYPKKDRTTKKRGYFNLKEGIWRDAAWYSLLGTMLSSTFGYLSPYYYISNYTKVKVPSLDTTTIVVAVPTIVMNVCMGLGRIGAGFLADILGPVNCFLISLFFGGLFQLVIWMFAETFGSIIAFSILYGLIGGWFLSLLPVVVAQLFGLESLASLVGFAILSNSPGQLAGASIGGAVLGVSGSYQMVALYSGMMMTTGSIILMYARFSRQKRIFAKF